MKKSFSALGITKQYETLLREKNIHEPTPVQEQAIPAALDGRNIFAQSPTGTGKTLAYLLPILARLDVTDYSVQAVILAPTQELSMQIFRIANELLRKSDSELQAVSLIGSTNISRQIEKLKAKPQLVVGSAGRILELTIKKKLRLQDVRCVVLDEADRLLDEQQEDDVKKVLLQLPEGCQYMMFSATLTRKTWHKADEIAPFVHIAIKDAPDARESVHHWYFISEFRDKIETLRKLFYALEIKRALVFVNRGDAVESLTEKLKYHKLKAAALSSGSNKMLRQKAIEDFSKGDVQLLLATDLAARGLDIAGIDYIINFDVAEDDTAYLHRAGRTARAGAKGTVITLADKREIPKLVELGKKLHLKLTAKKLRCGKVEDFVRRPQAGASSRMAFRKQEK